MKESGKSPVAIVALLLIIVIAVIFITKASKPPPEVSLPTMVDWTCEACDYRFVDAYQREPKACPKCRGEAVRTHYYYCSVHDHLFEAFKSKPNLDIDPDALLSNEDRMFYKLPGGEWLRGLPKKITCPKGNSDPATVRYCRPGSPERQ